MPGNGTCPELAQKNIIVPVIPFLLDVQNRVVVGPGFYGFRNNEHHVIKGPDAHTEKSAADTGTVVAGIGDDGVAVSSATGLAGSSPMHFIQKTFLDATSFYLHYSDYPSEMGLLAEALAQHYDQVIEILAESPAEMVIWSANVDDMITYPSLYEEHFLPWCHKAAEKLRPRGIFLVTHPDGENTGLMDLLARSRIPARRVLSTAHGRHQRTRAVALLLTPSSFLLQR